MGPGHEPAEGQRPQQVTGDHRKEFWTAEVAKLDQIGEETRSHSCTNFAILMAGLPLISCRAFSLGSVSTRTTM